MSTIQAIRTEILSSIEERNNSIREESCVNLPLSEFRPDKTSLSVWYGDIGDGQVSKIKSAIARALPLGTSSSEVKRKRAKFLKDICENSYYGSAYMAISAFIALNGEEKSGNISKENRIDGEVSELDRLLSDKREDRPVPPKPKTVRIPTNGRNEGIEQSREPCTREKDLVRMASSVREGVSSQLAELNIEEIVREEIRKALNLSFDS